MHKDLKKRGRGRRVISFIGVNADSVVNSLGTRLRDLPLPFFKILLQKKEKVVQTKSGLKSKMNQECHKNEVYM